MGGDPLARPGKAKALLRGRLDADRRLRHLQMAGQIPTDPGQMGRQLGGLRQHGGIHVADTEAGLADAGGHRVQQNQTVCAGIDRITVRKKMPDIPQGAGSQQGVHHRVCEHICIRVAQKPLGKGDLHPAKDQPSPLYQPMYVVAMSNSQDSSLQINSASATARSSGVVTFRLQ